MPVISVPGVLAPISGITLDASIVSDPVVAVNVGEFKDFEPTPPMLNRVKTARGMTSLPTTSSTYDELRAGGHLGSHGFPTSLPSGDTTFRLFWDIQENVRGTSTQTLVATWEGAATAPTFGGTASAWRNASAAATRREEFDVPAGASGNFWLDFALNAGDPVRNVKLVPKQYEALEAAGELFDPRFIDMHKPFRMLRFLTWSRVTVEMPAAFLTYAQAVSIGSVASFQGVYDPSDGKFYTNTSGGSFTPSGTVATDVSNGDLTEWVPPTSFENHFDLDDPILWQNTDDFAPLPLKYQVALANKCRADAWFCFPAACGEEAWRRMLTYIKGHLDPDLKAHVELSNEIWNSGFRIWQYLVARALGDWGETVQASSYYGAKVSAELGRLAGEVFSGSDRSRLVMVCPSHVASTGFTDEMLSGSVWQSNEPDDWFDPTTVYDAVAIASYYGSAFSSDSDQYDLLLRKNSFSGFTEQDVWDEIESRMGNASNSYSVPSRKALWAAQETVVAAAGLRLVAYEGGSHTQQAQSGTAWNALTAGEQTDYFTNMSAYIRSANEGRVYQDAIDDFKLHFDGPWMQYYTYGKQDNFGSWAVYNAWADISTTLNDSARTVAFENANDDSKWWTESRAAGTFEPIVRVEHADPVTTGTVLTGRVSGVSGAGTSDLVWKRLSDGATRGTGATYTMVAGDEGSAIRAFLGATDYHSGPVVYPKAPASYTPTASVSGGIVSVDVSTSPAYPAPALDQFQWYDSGGAVSGATSATYQPATAATGIYRTHREWVRGFSAVTITSSTVNVSEALPGAFTDADASASTIAGGLRINITTLPSDGGGDGLDRIEYRLTPSVGSVITGTLTSSPATGNHDITGLSPQQFTTVELRAVNGTGNGQWAVVHEDIGVYVWSMTVGNDVGSYGYDGGGTPYGSLTPATIEGLTTEIFLTIVSNSSVWLRFSGTQISGVTSLECELEGYGSFTMTWRTDVSPDRYEVVSLALKDYFVAQDGSTLGFNLYDTTSGRTLLGS